MNRAISFITLVVATAFVACSKPEEPAPSPAPAAQMLSSQDVFEFRIGELPAFALREGTFEFPNDNQVLGVGRTPEDVAAVLSAAGLPTDKVQLSVQPLLVKAADRVLLFDAGAGTAFGPAAGRLAGSMAEAGIEPQSVTDIFISHSHGDHVGGLVRDDGSLAFVNATIHISKPEWDFLSDANGAMAQNQGPEKHAAYIATLKPKVDAFAPGAVLVPQVVTAVEIRGHTPGHSGYRITSGTESLLYVGDTMHHFVVSVQKPDWTIAFDGDAATAQASRAALIAESASSGQRVFAVHFPFPGIGRFEPREEGFAWAAE